MRAALVSVLALARLLSAKDEPPSGLRDLLAPGMLVAVQALLAAHPDPSEAEIREFLAGNLCRCTGYAAIVAAVRSVAGARPAGTHA